MELWIRSQDRMTLCECNNIYIDDELVSPYYIKDDTLTLGKYSTKERALEVLDEIQNKLLKSKYDKASEDYGKHRDYKDTLIEISSSNYVYEMPKE